MSKTWIGSIKEHLWEGVFQGMIFLTVTLITAAISNEGELWGQCQSFILPIACISIVAGILINSLHRRGRRRKDFVNYGASGIYKIENIYVVLLFAISLVSIYVPKGLFNILMANLGVLILIWLGEYIYLKKIAKKLNGTRAFLKESTMVVLEEKPKNADDFFNSFVKFCGENNVDYEIVEKDIPGLVKINGMEYRLKLVEDYSMFGILDYYMVITTETGE